MMELLENWMSYVNELNTCIYFIQPKAKHNQKFWVVQPANAKNYIPCEYWKK